MVDYRSYFLNVFEEIGVNHKETSRSIISNCPSCGKDKLYLDKKHGNFICFSGSCGIKGKAPKLLSLIKDISYKEASDLEVSL